ncbi:MAG: SDR family oxidoreductase [Chloroflexi bacterium]|nr:SDR family oxidoreductase [Chloroflexota bacterium]
MKLEDRVAIITGAGKGIGRAIALAFAKEGAHIVAVARTAADVKRVAEEVEGLSRAALPLVADVAVEEQVKGMVQDALARFGRIDILVNNAGIGLRKPLLETCLEEWDAVLNINLRSIFLCCRAVLPHMIAQRRGKVINIASRAGRRGEAGLGAYCASKFGVIGLTEVLALEMKDYCINVNAICPGLVGTERIKGMYPGVSRWLEPEDVAAVAVFLAADDTRAISGTAIDI